MGGDQERKGEWRRARGGKGVEVETSMWGKGERETRGRAETKGKVLVSHSPSPASGTPGGRVQDTQGLGREPAPPSPCTCPGLPIPLSPALLSSPLLSCSHPHLLPLLPQAPTPSIQPRPWRPWRPWKRQREAQGRDRGGRRLRQCWCECVSGQREDWTVREEDA